MIAAAFIEHCLGVLMHAACRVIGVIKRMPGKGPSHAITDQREDEYRCDKASQHWSKGLRITGLKLVQICPRGPHGSTCRSRCSYARCCERACVSSFDRNGDGEVTPEEFSEAHQERMQGSPGVGRGMEPNMPTFADFDLNADGALTKEEFNEARAKRIAERSQQGYPMRNLPNAPTFEDIDTNRDGLIAPDEFAAHQMQHRRQMMQP
jgi:hypothetical protein